MSPYIPQWQRKQVDFRIVKLIADIESMIPPNTPDNAKDGIINYIITKILKRFYTKDGYIYFERAIGLLESCKLEFYRRHVAEYEELKRKEHGEVE